VPEFERLISSARKLRLLFDMTGFHGWGCRPRGRISIGIAHSPISMRLAIGRREKWQHGMAIFCKPFTRATVPILRPPMAAEARNVGRSVGVSVATDRMSTPSQRAPTTMPVGRRRRAGHSRFGCVGSVVIFGSMGICRQSTRYCAREMNDTSSYRCWRSVMRVTCGDS